MTHEDHKHDAPRSVRVFVITASDTRAEAEDVSGALLRRSIAAAGHALAGYRIAKDDPAEIRAALDEAAHADRADQLFKNGKKLLAEKKYAEACTAFEDSDRLEP